MYAEACYSTLPYGRSRGGHKGKYMGLIKYCNPPKRGVSTFDVVRCKSCLGGNGVIQEDHSSILKDNTFL